MREEREATRSLQTLGWLAATVVMVAGHLLAISAERPYFDFDLHYIAALIQRTGGDFLDNASVQELARQWNRPVAPEGVYGTPALIALVFMPLSLLTLTNAHVVWSVASVLAILIAVRKAVPDTSRWPFWILLLGMSPALLASQALGNPSTFTCALLIYTFGSLRLNQKTHAGVALGTAIALKAYPGFVLISLVVSRDWKTIKVVTATGIVAYLLTLFIIGPTDLFNGLTMLLSVGGAVHSGADNAGLPGIALAITDSQTLAKTVGVVALVASLVAVYLLRRLPPHVLFAVATMLMLVSQSLSWRNYFAVSIIGLLSLRDTNASKRLWGAGFLVFFATTGWQMLFMTDGNGFPTFNITQALGAIVLIVIVAVSASKQHSISRTSTQHRLENANV